jgi:hypothetical protein
MALPTGRAYLDISPPGPPGNHSSAFDVGPVPAGPFPSGPNVAGK